MEPLRAARHGTPDLEGTKTVTASAPSEAAGQALSLLDDLISRAKRAGADAADAVLFDGTAINHTQRLGKVEKLERSEGFDLGLRVFIGKRQAIVSTNDRDPRQLDPLVERAVAMARAVPEDPYCGLADPEDLARSFPTLDIDDPVEPSSELLIERARAAEDAAQAVQGVTNSEGADASWGRTMVVMAASNGFSGSYQGSNHAVSVSVLAGQGTSMERDYDYSTATHAADLEDAAAVGKRAGEQAVRRLGARKMPTGKVPIVFDPRVASGIVRHLVGAISGPSVARGTTFLKDKLGQQIFPEGITIVDDPHRQRGLRSKPFDGEGIANHRRNLIDKGVLTTWLLDLRSARQLGMKTTGHAARGASSPPGPSTTNLWLEPGAVSPDELMSDIEEGLYVNELMGQGVNGITGDYSRGASGFWIEKGKITFPVSEVTIAGNLLEMFASLQAANDLEFRGSTDAPTLRIAPMMLAGA